MALFADRVGGLNSSLAVKAPVRVATTANITLSGFQTIDGVTLADGDWNTRVLVKDQSTATDNGIYDASSSAWTRAKDFDGNSDFSKGTRVFVAEGTTQTGTYIVSSETDTDFQIDVDDIEFSTDIISIAATSATLDTDALSGFFSTYECLGAVKFQLVQAENQSDFDGGGFRDAVFVEHQDNDVVDYQALADQKVSYGVRSYVTGKQTAGVYQAQYKDLVALEGIAIGRVEWSSRGVTGVGGAAIGYGQGIIDNEFTASQPSDAVTQSLSMVAVQPIISSKKAAADGTHLAHAVYATNIGKRATAAYGAISFGQDGDNGQFEYILKADLATVATGAILMPLSASGNVGTYIIYDTGDRTEYDRATNTFSWTIAGSGELSLNAASLFPTTTGGLALGSGANQWNGVFLATGTAIDIANANWVATHSSGILTVGTGDLRITTAGTNSASVVTVGGSQTLTSKTLTSPTLTTPVLGTPTSGTLSSCTGLPFSTGLSGSIQISQMGSTTYAVGSVFFYTATVNFNSAGDTSFAITLPTGFTRYIFTAVRISHASGTLTTSAFNVFTASGGGGTQLFTANQTPTVSTASEETVNNHGLHTPTNVNTMTFRVATVPTLFFRIITPQGVAATADVMIGVSAVQ